MLLTVDLARLDVRPGHLLLDAGCGEGRHCFGSQSRGAHVVGLDLDLSAMRMPSKVLRKQGRQQVPIEPDYCGFDIPNAFVVGYGLDYNDEYRHLPPDYEAYVTRAIEG